MASGSQQALNFSSKLTLSGTFKSTVNINIGGAGGAGACAGYAADGPADEADGQDELADAADGAGAGKGGYFVVLVSKKGVRDIGCAEKGMAAGGGVLNFGT